MGQRSVLAVSAAVIMLAALVGGVSALASEVGPMAAIKPLDRAVVAQAKGYGPTLVVDVQTTDNCAVAAGVPRSLRVGPWATCAAVLTPAAAYQAARAASGQRPLAASLGMADWHVACMNPTGNCPVYNWGRVWIVQIDKQSWRAGIPSKATFFSCGPAGNLLFLDAARGQPRFELSWNASSSSSDC